MLITKDTSFYKRLLLLSLPIILQNLVSVSMTLLDNFMMGRLGDVATSGVYTGGQIQQLLQIFTTGIEAAILIPSAQYWGQGDTERAAKTLSLGIKCAAVLSISVALVCTLFSNSVVSLFAKDEAVIGEGAEYLKTLALSFPFFAVTQSLVASMRSVENTKVGLYASLAALAVKAALNYPLIFGSHSMGITGAATATLVARILEFLVMAFFVLKKDERINFSPKALLVGDKDVRNAFFGHAPVIFLAQLVWTANTLIYTTTMGKLGDSALVAGVGIANAMYSLVYVLANGVSSAVGIITGKTVGDARYGEMREYARKSELIALALGAFSFVTVFLTRDAFISIYSVTPEAAAYARSLINVIAPLSVGTCYQLCALFGLIRSGGDTSFVFKNDLVFLALVILPAAIATRTGSPPFVVFAALKCDQILKCITAAVKLHRFDWMIRVSSKTKNSGRA